MYQSQRLDKDGKHSKVGYLLWGVILFVVFGLWVIFSNKAVEAVVFSWLLVPIMIWILGKIFPRKDVKKIERRKVYLCENFQIKPKNERTSSQLGDLDGIRPFQKGDTKRMVHPKLSMKYGKLMVRQCDFEEEQEKVEKNYVRESSRQSEQTDNIQKKCSKRAGIPTWLLVLWMFGAMCLWKGYMLGINYLLQIFEKRFGFLCGEYIVTSKQEGLWFGLAMVWLLFLLCCLVWNSGRRSFCVCLTLAFFLTSSLLYLQPWSLAGKIKTLGNYVAKQVDCIRYQEYGKSLCYGVLTKEQEKYNGEQIALQVTMEEPRSMYFSGFVGGYYTGSGWKEWDGNVLYKNRETLGVLGENQFDKKQVGLCGSANQKLKSQRIAVRVKGASTRYVYCPYGTVNCNANTIFEERASASFADGIRGQSSYQCQVVAEAVVRYPTLSINAEKNPQHYKKQEAFYNAFVYRMYTKLPKNVESFLKKEIGSYDKKKEHVSYEEASAIVNDYLQQNLNYSEETSNYDGSSDFLIWLLSAKKKGRDIHYATAAALIYRYLGIPSRYVEGYCLTKNAVEKKEAYDTIDLLEKDAHAWVEIYLDGVGFVPMEFDPSWKGKMDRPRQEAEGEQERIKYETLESIQEEQTKKVNPVKVSKESATSSNDTKYFYAMCITLLSVFVGFAVLAILVYGTKKNTLSDIEKEYRRLLKRLKKRGANVKLPYSLWIDELEEGGMKISKEELVRALEICEKYRYTNKKYIDKEIKYVKMVKNGI